MDHLRVLLVPFQLTSLILVVVFSLLITLFSAANSILGIAAQIFLQIWVLKYCYVVVESLADGATEPPVMSTDMLSPFETRPWVQLGLIVAATALCTAIGGVPALILGIVFFLLLPASVAVPLPVPVSVSHGGRPDGAVIVTVPRPPATTE